MAEKTNGGEGLSLANTKKEMLEAYQRLLKQLKEKAEATVQSEKKIEERKKKEVLDAVESLSVEGVVKEISNLKLEMGKLLSQLSDRQQEEVGKFQNIQRAIQIKENELQEIYEIGKSAETLSALIEAQHQKRREFEEEMAERKKELEGEIGAIREKWEKEKKAREAQLKEQEEAEKKKREREKEEYEYALKRQQMLTKDKSEDEKAKQEKAILLKKEQLEKELSDREKTVAEKEEELGRLRAQVSGFQKELDAAVARTAKDLTDRLKLEAKNREDFLKKEFEGERNVLTTRIESLEKTVKEQNAQIAKLSEQQEKAYQKVQDIAVKAIEGSSNLKSLTSLQQLITEQAGKKSQEK